jgi:hypothetical protein
MSSREWSWLLLTVAVVVVVALAAATLWRNGRAKRRRALRERFGPEYERLVAEYGDAARAEAELESRARRVRKLSIKELSAAECEAFGRAWKETQERFVDTPELAVRSAHELVERVMRARGYPVDDFEQRIADLSVDHAGVVQHYRAAHALHEANQQGRGDTEELRQAMVHYRALFAELLGEKPEPSPGSRRLNTAHA